MLVSHCQCYSKYSFQLQELYNRRSVILNEKEKCWNNSEEPTAGRNDDSLHGELLLELHVYSVYYFQSHACYSENVIMPYTFVVAVMTIVLLLLCPVHLA